MSVNKGCLLELVPATSPLPPYEKPYIVEIALQMLLLCKCLVDLFAGYCSKHLWKI